MGAAMGLDRYAYRGQSVRDSRGRSWVAAPCSQRLRRGLVSARTDRPDMANLRVLLLILSFLCFCASATGIPAKFNLQSLGLALWLASALLV